MSTVTDVGLNDSDLAEELEEHALPRDPARRISLGEHQDSKIQHGSRVHRKHTERKGTRRHRFQRKPDLPLALKNKLHSAEPGHSGLYTSFKLTSCQNAELKKLKKNEREQSRRSRGLVRAPRTA